MIILVQYVLSWFGIWDTDFAGMSSQFLEDASIFNHWALTVGHLRDGFTLQLMMFLICSFFFSFVDSGLNRVQQPHCNRKAFKRHIHICIYIYYFFKAVL